MAILFHPWMKTVFFTVFLSLSPVISAVNHHDHDPDLFHYKTRPDLKPPKWDIIVHDESRLTTGYWFVGIKPSLDKTIGTDQPWFGPHIYDQQGELVWSGSRQLDTSNVMDFRLSKIKGKDHLTVLDRDRREGLIINDNYELVDSFPVDWDHRDNVNGHELNFVGDGSKVLVVRNNKEESTPGEGESIGHSGPCRANYNGMRELDGNALWMPIFDWTALGHITLNESTEKGGNIDHKCENDWDFIHTNSLDKTDDGDYILSGRHTSTIYKISHVDGHIVWRMGGKFSDFDMGGIEFSRQHNIRYQGENHTHMLVSFLDNAKGQDANPPSHDFSRGLLLALNKHEMTVTMEHHYDHPYRDHENWHYANRRGSLQILPNRNVLMGWSEQALQTEHTEDGEILMEAVFIADWVGAYRNYKFDFVGKPLTRPDVYAVSYNEDEFGDKIPTTDVAVSWNGDTEVRTWKLYARVENDRDEHLMETLPRSGFETSFHHDGLWRTVRFEGLDSKNKTIVDSGEIRVEQHPSPPPFDAYKDPAEGISANRYKEDGRFLGNPHVTFALLFILGGVLSAFAVLLGWLGFLPLRWLTERTRGLREVVRYKKVARDEFEEEEEGMGLPLANGNGKLRLQSPQSPHEPP
ncbi:uncharacterized protein LTR77_001144 [Saxophila tyrrhenica]|uniref:ASST-domain-containing protein n=1 Tax=Saxophila tyrrhenica TaxID=1690608 RepID=A0AAV9PP67_9PEZI|nr:hypothetical protein LTR77_001144 [Saxophila tyrrhenica]